MFEVHHRQMAHSSLLAWAFSSCRVSYPGELGCTLCAAAAPCSPLAQAQFALLDWPHPVSFIAFPPPKLEEPQGLEFTPAPSPGRKIREIQGKRFPSLVLFIRPLLLPPEAPPGAQWPHCVSWALRFLLYL